MTRGSTQTAISELPSDAGELFRAALFCLGLGAAIFVGGLVWLGRAGMFEPKSPDFFPLPDFFTVACILIGGFFLVRAGFAAARYGNFGTSTLVVSDAIPGAVMRAELRLSKPIETTGFRAILRCESTGYRGRAGPGTSTLASERLWEGEALLPAGSMVLPFAIPIPADGLRSGRRPKPRTGVHPGPADVVSWSVIVTAPTRGIDYRAEFPIIVSAPARAAKSAAPTRVLPAAGEAALQVAAAILGGQAPSPEERAEEAAAEAAGEAPFPFAGQRRPMQQGQGWVSMVFAGFGLFLAAVGLYATALHVVWHIHPEATRDGIGTIAVGVVLIGIGVFLRRQRVTGGSWPGQGGGS